MHKAKILFLLVFVVSVSKAQHISSISDPTLGTSEVITSNTNVSYDLYTIQNGEITVPISLYYNGLKGIKVNQFSSRVGLGWNLSAGGVITRTVVGYPDDCHKNQASKQGILFNNNLETIHSLDPFAAGRSEIEHIINHDYEPDIFTIQAPTFSAKFIFGMDNEIICIDNPNLRIEYQQNVEGNLISFEVTDELGLKYTFD